ncbi:MAG: hypothetical protein PVG88_01410 [Methyloceanibacter sp.]|jgi:hypothetical protein
MKHILSACLLAAGLTVAVTVPASAMYVVKDNTTGKCMLMTKLPSTPTQRFSMMGLYTNKAQAKRVARRCNRGRM